MNPFEIFTGAKLLVEELKLIVVEARALVQQLRAELARARERQP